MEKDIKKNIRKLFNALKSNLIPLTIQNIPGIAGIILQGIHGTLNALKEEELKNNIEDINTKTKELEIASIMQSLKIKSLQETDIVYKFRINNIITTLDSIEKKILEMEDNEIDIDWICSKKSIQIFKKVIEEIEFEADEEKIETISNAVSKFASKEFENENKKFYILMLLLQLNGEQIRILKILKNYKHRIGENKTIFRKPEIQKEFEKESESFFEVEVHMLVHFGILDSDRNHINKTFIYSILEKVL